MLNKSNRILLNIAATYGRSLVGLVCGLFAARWALMALGVVDFGLYGVVAGVVAFIGFINGVLALAVGRFFAFEVGREGEIQAWFSTALFLHAIVAVGLMAVGWPVGEWTIRHVLTIPAERVEACVNVFRLACLACFVGMVTVPFSAMYTAKQKIAELTVYDIVATVAKTVALYYMALMPGDWLTGYALLLAAVSAAPAVLISIRALKTFPECRIVRGELVNCERIRALLKYAGWECFGSGAVVLKRSGGALLVNEYLGAVYNSSMSYSNSVAEQTASLSNSLTGAFYPAITNAYGAGNLEQARKLALRACSYGGLLVLLFAVPMALEAEYVFKLWLKTPPPGVDVLCVYVLAATFIERVTSGCGLAINASGRIARYQFWSGLGLASVFPLMWMGLFLFREGADGGSLLALHAVGLASVFAYLLNGAVKVWFARQIVGMRLRAWLLSAALPTLVALMLSLAAGGLVVRSLPSSFVRAILTGLASAVGVGSVMLCAWLRRRTA